MDIEQALAFGRLLSEPEQKWEGFKKMKYALTDQDFDKIENSYTYHAPKPDQIPRYEDIRNQAKQLAMSLMERCPPCRELSVALTNLEQAVMWANKAIACNE